MLLIPVLEWKSFSFSFYQETTEMLTDVWRSLMFSRSMIKCVLPERKAGWSIHGKTGSFQTLKHSEKKIVSSFDLPLVAVTQRLQK